MVPTASGPSLPPREPSGQRRMVQIYLSPDLAEMVRQVQAGAGWSNAELVLSAIQATYQQLEGVIAAESAIPTGGLFSREYRPRRGTGSATVQFGIRLRQDDIDRIDELVSSAQARSRSAYIVSALRTYVAQQNPE